MKRSLIILLSIIALIAVQATPRVLQQRVAQPQCAASIAECPLEGCSSDNHHDTKLNRLKNTTSNKSPVMDRPITWIKTHPDPQNFQRLGNRDELTALGEGQQLRVVGYLLRAKLELGGESCNCYFRTEETTDNHLVLRFINNLNKVVTSYIVGSSCMLEESHGYWTTKSTAGACL